MLRDRGFGIKAAKETNRGMSRAIEFVCKKHHIKTETNLVSRAFSLEIGCPGNEAEQN